MIEQLFILGNGFDMAHRLPTGYEDFVDYIKREDAPDDEKTLLDFLIHYIGEPFYDGDFLWKDFENELGEADFRKIYQMLNIEKISYMMTQIKILITTHIKRLHLYQQSSILPRLYHIFLKDGFAPLILIKRSQSKTSGGLFVKIKLHFLLLIIRKHLKKYIVKIMSSTSMAQLMEKIF